MTTHQSIDVADVAEDAAHAACRYIQAELGNKYGDVAADHFSGEAWTQLTALLADYARAELSWRDDS
jgi:uncharacterized protein YdgA (DUF945 family)